MKICETLRCFDLNEFPIFVKTSRFNFLLEKFLNLSYYLSSLNLKWFEL
jgi:hypothetical protein